MIDLQKLLKTRTIEDSINEITRLVKEESLTHHKDELEEKIKKDMKLQHAFVVEHIDDLLFRVYAILRQSQNEKTAFACNIIFQQLLHTKIEQNGVLDEPFLFKQKYDEITKKLDERYQAYAREANRRYILILRKLQGDIEKNIGIQRREIETKRKVFGEDKLSVFENTQIKKELQNEKEERLLKEIQAIKDKVYESERVRNYIANLVKAAENGQIITPGIVEMVKTAVSKTLGGTIHVLSSILKFKNNEMAKGKNDTLSNEPEFTTNKGKKSVQG